MYQEWQFYVPVRRRGMSPKYMDENMDERPSAMYVRTPLRAPLQETKGTPYAV